MDLAVVIVNWNVRDLLRRCLVSVRRGLAEASLDGRVVVVDNGSRDDSVAMLRADFPWVQVIASPNNVGFTAGNNLALRALGFGAPLSPSPAPDMPRYVLLLNPDTEIVGAALAHMLAYMDAHPDVGLLGPRLRYPDGSVQPSRRRFPTLRSAFLESTLLQRWRPDAAALRDFYMADRPDDVTQDVDWVVGAAMLVRRAALCQVGLLDEGYFMYSEEVDWARRLKAAGWRVVYLPQAEIMHYEGRSSEQVVAQRHIYFQSSKVRYIRKWHGAPAAEMLRLFLLATYAYQMGEEGVKWLVGHKRPLRAARLAAYRRVLASGLR